MAEKPRRPVPEIKGDKLVLDFGKTTLRPGQPAHQPATTRKLPPVPGRVPRPPTRVSRWCHRRPPAERGERGAGAVRTSRPDS